jgi:hypothetical protein
VTLHSLLELRISVIIALSFFIYSVVVIGDGGCGLREVSAKHSASTDYGEGVAFPYHYAVKLRTSGLSSHVEPTGIVHQQE